MGKRPGRLARISDNRACETVLIEAQTANGRIPGRVVWRQRRM
jgi:hypothetical protein